MNKAVIVFKVLVFLLIISPLVMIWYYMFSDLSTTECIKGMEYYISENGIKTLKEREGGGVVYCKNN